MRDIERVREVEARVGEEVVEHVAVVALEARLVLREIRRVSRDGNDAGLGDEEDLLAFDRTDLAAVQDHEQVSACACVDLV